MEAETVRLDGPEKGLDRVEGRLDRVEERLGAVERTLVEVDGTLSVITTRIASLDARLGLVAKLPGWWQMPAVILSTVTRLGLLHSFAQYLRAPGPACTRTCVQPAICSEAGLAEVMSTCRFSAHHPRLKAD